MKVVWRSSLSWALCGTICPLSCSKLLLDSVLWPFGQEKFWQKAGGEGRLMFAALGKGLASVSAILVSADLRIPALVLPC